MVFNSGGGLVHSVVVEENQCEFIVLSIANSSSSMRSSIHQKDVIVIVIATFII